MNKYLVVGSGLCGSTIASRLHNAGIYVEVIEKRGHIGGACFDYVNDKNYKIHKYGSYIFHTNSEKVWEFIKDFGDWREYLHKVKVVIGDKKVNLPINFSSLKELFPDKDYEKLLKDNFNKERVGVRFLLDSPVQEIKDLGSNLLRLVYADYTLKHIGRRFGELEPQVQDRVPVVLSYDDRFFDDKYQYVCESHVKVFDNLLKDIKLTFNEDFIVTRDNYKDYNIIYTGPIDAFFNYKFGKLPYRGTLYDYYYSAPLIAAQVNYPSLEYQYNRLIDMNQLTGQPREIHLIAREFPNTVEEFYPVLTEDNKKLFNLYKKEAKQFKNVTFCGRLADYQYYNMDQVIARGLKISEDLINNETSNTST